MGKPQTGRVQGLAGKLNISERGGVVNILFFSDQRVPAQSGLNADLLDRCDVQEGIYSPRITTLLDLVPLLRTLGPS